MGFDEVRVRYRQQRRAVIREIICRQVFGEPLQQYVSEQSLRWVNDEDRNSFIDDIWEDLKEMDASRIASLGITLDQLNAWLIARDKQQ